MFPFHNCCSFVVVDTMASLYFASCLLLILALMQLPISCSYSFHMSRSSILPAADDQSNAFLSSSPPKWINQTLDHFAPEDSPTFQQRYFEFLDYFDAPGGPIFLTICGESTCGGIYNDYVGVLAKRFGAALVTLEHRYYGYSSPFSELTTKNLKYLTSKQALSDLAAFRNFYQNQINQKYNLSDQTAGNAWITFGGSYSGALSAWFRLKFPHLTRGSLASSAVIHAIEDYYAYDEQVADSVGPSCSDALRAVKAVVNDYLESNATYVKSLFDAQMLTNDADFLSLLADSTAVAVQYSFSDVLCKPLLEAYQSDGSVLGAYQDFVKTYIYGGFGVSPLQYSREHIKNDTSAGPGSGGRLWSYQFCTEFGFLQTAPASDSIRFAQLNQGYYLDLCNYTFGKGTSPSVDVTNLYYGGSRIAGSRIFFTNGSQDPWRHASKQVSSPGEPAFVITCRNCAHCVDLSGCPQFPFVPAGDARLCEPRESIDQARKLISEYIEMWIREPY